MVVGGARWTWGAGRWRRTLGVGAARLQLAAGAQMGACWRGRRAGKRDGLYAFAAGCFMARSHAPRGAAGGQHASPCPQSSSSTFRQTCSVPVPFAAPDPSSAAPLQPSRLQPLLQPHTPPFSRHATGRLILVCASVANQRAYPIPNADGSVAAAVFTPTPVPSTNPPRTFLGLLRVCTLCVVQGRRPIVTSLHVPFLVVAGFPTRLF